ncbi:hypothetical protein B6I21_08000 [candidate division KSB1 bacterium 4572_119]|nr:MAG: hypothetical protein B6I21_08000 [candidate division KSB1 bacterium 4572_119]
MKEKKILLVEDEAIIALEMKDKLQNQGYISVYTASTGKDAIQIANQKKPDVIIMDIMLKGDINGIEAAVKILHKNNIPIIYITGNSNFKSNKKLLTTNPVAVLSKPASDWEVFNAIEKALNHSNN